MKIFELPFELITSVYEYSIEVFLGLTVALGLIFTPVPNCDEGSEAVAYGRSLTQYSLQRLFIDMEAFSRESHGAPRDISTPPGDTLPPPFADIDAVFVRLRNQRLMIRLEGCFDHHVDLWFDGILEQDKRPRQIVLSWGQFSHSGYEVLWSEN